jgi:ABC-2 type transport system ATP-binding protein
VTAGNWVIEAEGLRKVFGRKVAVADLSLRVAAGEVFGFLGPNGAGKTTAMKMLLGLVHPTAGRGFVLGHPVGSRKRAGGLGFFPNTSAFTIG